VDFLESLSVPCYKIASFENIDIPLIKKIAATGKPMIISTGMASLKELEEAVVSAREGGCKNIILLKCTSTYPANPNETNIMTIPHMRKHFNCCVGLSDHTLGIGVAIASIALGACVVEKHFTLSRSDGGVDSVFSLEPSEMNTLVVETIRAWNSLGKVNYEPSVGEKKSLKFRRSIYVVKDIKKGEALTKDNMKIIRPGFGLVPKYYDSLIGEKVKKDIKRGTALEWKLIM
jgi:sialic acid synthase SpsE